MRRVQEQDLIEEKLKIPTTFQYLFWIASWDASSAADLIDKFRFITDLLALSLMSSII